MENIYYVYLHRRASDNSVFYVGKGKNKRAWDNYSRNPFWNKTVAKHGLTVEIVFDKLDEETAFQCEIDTILEMKYFGHKLCNMTNGGEGSSGALVTEETRKKLSKIHQGRKDSDEAKRNKSLAQKGLKKPLHHVEAMRQRMLGSKQSEATKEKRRQTFLKGKFKNDKNVYTFFSKDDVFIGTRDDLADYTGIPRQTFRTLFGKYQNQTAYGWGILKLNALLLFKEILK